MDRVVTVLVFTAALAGTTFMAAYLRNRPWRTQSGRLVLAFMGALGALLVLAVLFRLLGSGSDVWRYVRLLSWVVINIIMFGAVLALFRSQRNGRMRDQENRENNEDLR